MRSHGISAFVISALLLSCGTAHDHEDHVHLPDGSHPHENGSDAAPIVITRYTDSTELYLEFDPLVQGYSSRVLAHFTALGNTFGPVEEGSLKVSVEVNGNSTSGSVNEPHDPGIFIVELSPSAVGIGRMVIELTTGQSVERFILDPVTVHATQAEVAKESGSEAPSAAITYLKEQQWRVGFANVKLEPTSFHDVLQVGGTIRASAGNESMVIAPVSGVVRYGGSMPLEGMRVSQGETLLLIASGGMVHDNLDSEFLKAKAALEQASADMQRADTLVVDRIISQKEYAETRNRYESARVTFNTVGRDRTEGGRKITAPFDGHIRDLRVAQGQFVEAGTPLMTVTRSGRMQVIAHVPQRDAHRLAGITSANFRAASDDRVLDTDRTNGRLLSFGRSTSGGMVPIIFEVDDPGDILPGSFAEVWLKSGPVQDALVVPVEALLEEQGHYSVYVQTGGETVEKRSVTLGANDGILVELQTGVKAGERVVSKGAFQIKLATMSGTMPAHGHEH